MENNNLDDNSKYDSIGFFDILEIFIKQRKLLLFTVVFFIIISSIYLTFAERIYRSEITFIEADSLSSNELNGIESTFAAFTGLGLDASSKSEDIALATLFSKKFLSDFIERNNLKTLIYSELWDKEKQIWLGKEPSNEKTFTKFKSLINHSRDSKTDIHELSISWPNSEGSADLANDLLKDLNSYNSSIAIERANRKLAFLEQEQKNLRLINTKTVMSKLIELTINEKMLASDNTEFSFQIIDPAYASDRPHHPRPILILGGALTVSFFLGLVLSLIKHLYLLRQSNEK